ncbi:hypothetical protein THAOC_20535 [Thalassiosira oceanica]|uniref:Uncharacterized protein n=1 Tax=Thalassiosira oceanica TaxID=159749 RepID=K0SLC2_THAOC|nr:hypothetical protein THAOC_20535 [Thalassiosira oceanica]|eukprot:EJK59267.1 hypothetical protein THAOC_20535 [Thalassiosira oceanica]
MQHAFMAECLAIGNRIGRVQIGQKSPSRPIKPLTVQLLVLELGCTLLARLLVLLAVGPLAVRAAILDEAAGRAVLQLDGVAPLLAAVGADFLAIVRNRHAAAHSEIEDACVVNAQRGVSLAKERASSYDLSVVRQSLRLRLMFELKPIGDFVEAQRPRTLNAAVRENTKESGPRPPQERGRQSTAVKGEGILQNNEERQATDRPPPRPAAAPQTVPVLEVVPRQCSPGLPRERRTAETPGTPGTGSTSAVCPVAPWSAEGGRVRMHAPLHFRGTSAAAS